MMPSPMLLPVPLPSSLMNNISTHNSILCCDFKDVNLSNQRGTSLLCSARRQIRYQDGDDADSDEEYGHNEQISKLESYSQSAKGEVLVVHALVDQEKLMCLSSRHLLMKLSLRDSDHCHVLSFRSCPCRSSFVP
ncbi:hypothetical protein AAZX31_07G158900 [Glycine max]|uniref:Uncharacterized protein n=2 Tax=Glycine subgen. Soja TaxID=1462606 RepID=K7L2A7_SOYBN|nr:hypothetical protein GLYMA_07G171100v4 [Glycine max]RZC03314.1 hypothetical protein D0Y65_018123 [Glycine soja]